jgi:hypothetical protein
MYQGCQIFLAAIYQNGEKYTRIATKLPNYYKIYQMAVIYFKWLKNIPTFSITRPSKIYPSKDCWFENAPSGNPDLYPEL